MEVETNKHNSWESEPESTVEASMTTIDQEVQLNEETPSGFITLQPTTELDHLAVWEGCLNYMRSRIEDDAFIIWFDPIIPIRLEDNELFIQVPSMFFFEWLEEHYITELREALDLNIGKEGKLLYSIAENTPNQKQSSKETKTQTNELVNNSYPYNKNNLQSNKNIAVLMEKNAYLKHLQGDFQLNPQYTFENFIEGDCNRLARNAGFAVADKPGQTSFNPLLLYGGVGLGKTHILQAIGNQVQKYLQDKSVIYVSVDKFTNQFIDALKNNNASFFSDFYMQIDVLLIDDVQFLAGKEKIQEIFFHIFNHLRQHGKQIVLTSDCPPKELKGLQERLVSRFKSGLSADLQQPDLETRMAIVHKKIQDENIIMPNDVIEYLAHSVDSNIRELEGTIVSLVAQASLNKVPMTLELAKQTVQRIIQPNENKEVSIDDIQHKVSEYFGMTVNDLKDKTRKKEIVIARQIAMYLVKKYTEFSLKSIGYHFGGRDHSTVIHAIQCIDEMLIEKREVKAYIDDISKLLMLSK